MAAFWATIVSYVLGIPARYYAYAAVALGIFFVGCHCGRGFGISPQKADSGECWDVGKNLSPAERKIVNAVFAEKGLAPVTDPCPVNGSNCTCGCLSGQPCNCALSRVADVRLTRRTGFDAYCDLVNSLRPGDSLKVYVGFNPPANATNSVRWDGYPGAGVGDVIRGYIGPDGNPYRVPAPAPAVQYQPVFQRFGGNCPSGNCRSR